MMRKDIEGNLALGRALSLKCGSTLARVRSRSRFIHRRGARVAHAGNGRLGEADLLLDFVGEATLLGRERRIVSKQSGVAEDGGKRIVDLVSGTRGQTAKGRELLRKCDAFLDCFQTFVGGFRKRNQALKLAFKNVEPEKTQRAEKKHSAKDQTQAERDDHARCRAFQVAVYREYGQ